MLFIFAAAVKVVPADTATHVVDVENETSDLSAGSCSTRQASAGSNGSNEAGARSGAGSTGELVVSDGGEHNKRQETSADSGNTVSLQVMELIIVL